MRQTNFFFPPKLLLQYNPYSGHDYTNLQVESYYHLIFLLYSFQNKLF